MSWASTWTDLITIVSSAPYFGHRRAADVLLAREESAEMDLQTFLPSARYRTLVSGKLIPPPRLSFFAYFVMSELGLRDGETLTQWNARHPPERFCRLPPDALLTDKVMQVAGNPNDHLSWHRRFRPGHRGITIGGTPHTPQPQSTLIVARAEVDVFAAELVAQVIDDMGAPAWAAARAVYE
jgi:hypothetical protein